MTAVYTYIAHVRIVPCGKTVTSENVPLTAQRSKFGQTCRGNLSTGRSHNSSYHRQDQATTARTTSLTFWRRVHDLATSQTCCPSKTSGQSSGTRSTRWTCDVKCRSHHKLPVGQVLPLGRNAGQRDVWEAGAFEGLCGEVWRIHQQ